MGKRKLSDFVRMVPEDVKIYVKWQADLTALLLDALDAHGLTRSELAQRLEKSPSEISKWLSGDHNFTLRSLAKIQAELNTTIVEIPKVKHNPRYEKTGISVHGRIYVISNRSCRYGVSPRFTKWDKSFIAQTEFTQVTS